jgi:hypothetical protein
MRISIVFSLFLTKKSHIFLNLQFVKKYLIIKCALRVARRCKIGVTPFLKKRGTRYRRCSLVLAPAVRKNGFVYIFFCKYPQYSLENTIKEQKIKKSRCARRPCFALLKKAGRGGGGILAEKPFSVFYNYLLKFILYCVIILWVKILLNSLNKQ